MSGRLGAALAFVVVGAGLVGLLVIATPWRTLPTHPHTAATSAAPERDFSADEIARENAFHRAVRPPLPPLVMPKANT